MAINQCQNYDCSKHLACAFNKLRSQLLRLIDIQFGLLDELRALKVLNDDQIQVIRGNQNTSDQVSQLLDYLGCMPNKQHKLFLVALFNNKQTHVNSFIIGRGYRSISDGTIENWPLRQTAAADLISRNWPVLVELLDVKNGLSDEMFTVKCISERHKQFIEAGDSDPERNDRLLNVLMRRTNGDFKKFITCLVKTKQNRVAGILDVKLRNLFPPLKEHRVLTLKNNHSSLVELIDTQGGLVNELYTDDCITKRQKEFIETAASQSESNSRLLEVIKRGSDSDFDKFISCLLKTGQQQVCRILNEGAVLARFVASVTDSRTLLYSRERSRSRISINDIRDYEVRIIEQFITFLSNLSNERREMSYCTVSRAMLELRKRDAELMVINRSHSIAVYFLCKSPSGLLSLENLYSSGQLRIVLACMFNTLLNNGPSVAVHQLRWDGINYAACAQHLLELSGLTKCSEMYQMLRSASDVVCETHRCLITTDRLPCELMEMILIKAASQQLRNFNILTPAAGVYALISVGAVARLWWFTLSHQRYNRLLLRKQFTRLCHPFLRNPIQMTNVRIKHNVSGMAELNGKLYVVCGRRNSIEVLNSSPPFNRVGSIAIPDLNDPIDVVACVDTRQLYIADRETHAIWRVNLSSAKEVDKFVSIQWQPLTLSTHCCRLLVVPVGGTALFVYGNDSVLRKNVKVPNNMEALHAVETTHDTYVVSHNRRWSDNMHSEHESLSEIDNRGQVVRKFNCPFDVTGSIKVSRPEYLTLAGNCHVIVADRYNQRIVVLNEDLQLRRVLINSLGGQQPVRLCFCRRTGLLFVTYFQQETLTIFKIQ